MKGFIYKTTCLVNNRYYIGSTSLKSVEARLRKNKGHKGMGSFFNDFRKYGYTNFKTEEIDSLEYENKCELLILENKYILLYLTDPLCYNCKIYKP